jgi:hypothetical protein
VQLNRAGWGLLIEGSGLLELLRFAGVFLARSAGLEPAAFSVRSQDTGVYSCLWLFENRLSKQTSDAGCSQLFTWVTVKSLSTTIASEEQTAAFVMEK